MNHRCVYQGQENAVNSRFDNFELRMLNTDLGRWISPDPAGQFASPYISMGNNPVSGVDPDGGYMTSAGVTTSLFYNAYYMEQRFQDENRGLSTKARDYRRRRDDIDKIRNTHDFFVALLELDQEFGVQLHDFKGTEYPYRSAYINDDALGRDPGSIGRNIIKNTGNETYSDGHGGIKWGEVMDRVGSGAGTSANGKKDSWSTIFSDIDRVNVAWEETQAARAAEKRRFLESPEWGKMSVISNVNGGAGLTDGHAWIRLESNSGVNSTVSLGWNGGFGRKNEFWNNNDVGYGYGEVSKSQTINLIQYNKIMEFNSNPNNLNWTPFNTCAGYSCGLWNNITGGNLSARDWFFFTTPRKLANSMINNH